MEGNTDERVYQRIMDGTNLSLDEFIRKRSMTDQFGLILKPKRRLNIKQEVLDNNLEEYIRESGIVELELEERSSFEENNVGKVGGKFDRKSMRDDEIEDSDEEMPLMEASDSDSRMENARKNARQFMTDDDERELNELLNFDTPETLKGIRVRSQQFRLLPENLVDRPQGVKRLEVLPLDESERYKRPKIYHGRVQKNRLSQNSSFASFKSRNTNMTLGSFVEKGKFTYKFGDGNGDGEERVIGIERAKHNSLTTPADAHIANPATQPIIVNMNMDGFLGGVTSLVNILRPAPTEPADDLKCAAMNLLKMLQEKGH